jgi:hypothetical protein
MVLIKTTRDSLVSVLNYSPTIVDANNTHGMRHFTWTYAELGIGMQRLRNGERAIFVEVYPDPNILNGLEGRVVKAVPALVI